LYTLFDDVFLVQMEDLVGRFRVSRSYADLEALISVQQLAPNPGQENGNCGAPGVLCRMKIEEVQA